jgi:DNA-binding beta-propeller fold protein YncE
LHEPQGIGYTPKADVIAVASAGDGSVRLFHGEDFASLGTVDLKDDADNIRVDFVSGRLVVGYGGGGLAVLDPVSRSVVGSVKLAAHPEGFQLDPVAGRAFVNLPDARQIAVVELATGNQLATWQVAGLRANFPMARDATGGVIATVFRSPPRLVLVDAQAGTTRLSIETCGDADDVFFDSKRKRIYVSCGAGSVDVFQQGAAGYRLLSRITTSSGARTSLFVPELDRLFVAARAGYFGLGSDAAILVLRPQP